MYQAISWWYYSSFTSNCHNRVWHSIVNNRDGGNLELRKIIFGRPRLSCQIGSIGQRSGRPTLDRSLVVCALLRAFRFNETSCTFTVITYEFLSFGIYGLRTIIQSTQTTVIPRHRYSHLSDTVSLQGFDLSHSICILNIFVRLWIETNLISSCWQPVVTHPHKFYRSVIFSIDVGQFYNLE